MKDGMMEMDYQMITIILSAIFLITYILLHRNIKTSTLLSPPRHNLPPGPPPLLLLGNLHQLGHTPHRTLHRLASVYGPIMHLKIGAVTTVVISSPQLARQILQKHDNLFSARFVSDAMRASNHSNLSIAFLPVCLKWKNLRKALATQLFTQQRLDASRAIRQEKVRQLINHVADNAGKPLDIGLIAFITMINFLSVTLMSVDLADYQSTGPSMEFRNLVMEALELVGKPNVSDFFPALRFLDLQGLRRQSNSILSRMLGIIGKVVDQREMSGARAVSESYSRDVLDALLHDQCDQYELNSEDIKHLFLDLFVAGTDTSSNTIEWAMSELMHNPEAMAKAQSEVRSVIPMKKLIHEADIPNLPYLQAVVKETLRLHPPAPFLVPHKAIADVEVDGFTVHEGTQVLVNAWSVGRNTEAWANPDLFDPDRFSESKVEYKGTNFELIPFGAGRRICPGLPLAQRIVHIMLAALIHSFDWELENGMKPEEIDMRDRAGLSGHKIVPLRAIPIPRGHGSQLMHL